MACPFKYSNIVANHTKPSNLHMKNAFKPKAMELKDLIMKQ